MRIMTSNIWGDYFGNPVEVREDLLFTVFKRYSPDVLGMQEYTPGWYDGNMYNWLSEEYYPVGTEHDVIRVGNAHQLVNLMKHLNVRYNCPVFAFGDMNTRISSGVFEVYRKNGIKHLYDLAERKDEVSSHHGDPVLKEDGRYHGEKTKNGKEFSIDHIVVLGENIKVLEYRIIEDIEALDATDHSPVYADVTI